MNHGEFVIFFGLIAVAGVISVLPLYFCIVGPNWFYGFRFGYSTMTKFQWYAVNREWARLIMKSAIAMPVVGLFYLPLPEVSFEVQAVLFFAPILTWYAITSIRAYKYLQKIQRDGSTSLNPHIKELRRCNCSEKN